MTEERSPPEEPREPEADDGSSDDLLDIGEPIAFARLSSYAVAAIVLAAVGLWTAGQSAFPAFFPEPGLPWREIVFMVVPVSLIPVAGAGAALWAASKAEEEIVLSEGQLGGVGFYRTSRVVAALTLAIVAIGIGVRFIAPSPFEEFGPGEGEGDAGVVEFEDAPPPPDLPPPPVGTGP